VGTCRGFASPLKKKKKKKKKRKNEEEKEREEKKGVTWLLKLQKLDQN